MDRNRFRSTAAYLDALPNGADAYPTFVAKASVYRNALDDKPLRHVAGALPASLVEIIENPVPVTAWVSEARTRAIMHAIFDDHFRTREAFLAWVYQRNASMFAGAVYRVLMLVVSPSVMLHGAELRWGTFHRGIQVKVSASARAGALRMSFPPGLLDDLDIDAHAEVFRAAVDAAGARGSEVRVTELSATHAVYAARWS